MSNITPYLTTLCTVYSTPYTEALNYLLITLYHLNTNIVSNIFQIYTKCFKLKKINTYVTIFMERTFL